MKTNGAVVMGHDLRVRVSPKHHRSLSGLARSIGTSPTVLAEHLLTRAIEREARGFVMYRVMDALMAWRNARAV